MTYTTKTKYKKEKKMREVQERWIKYIMVFTIKTKTTVNDF